MFTIFLVPGGNDWRCVHGV